MAKASEQATVAEAPAPSAPEPSGRAILESAKVELRNLDQGPSPAEPEAPDSATAPPPEPPTPAPVEKEGSRREQGTRLREQIRKELEAEYADKARAEAQRQQNEKQQREFDELVQRAESGDWEAKDRVLSILKSNRGMQAAIAQGRNAVLEELGRDITKSVYDLEGLDEDGQKALMSAPSVAEFGKSAYDHGRRTERAIHESTIATLKAEIESLKGRIAGTIPSPTATNGSAVGRGQPQVFKTMRDAFAAAAAEHGYRTSQE